MPLPEELDLKQIRELVPELATLQGNEAIACQPSSGDARFFLVSTLLSYLQSALDLSWAATTDDILNLQDQIDALYIKEKTTVTKTLYVDNVNGSDVTGDGSTASPFASLKAAFAYGTQSYDFVYQTSGGRGVLKLQLVNSATPYLGVDIIQWTPEVQIVGNIADPTQTKISTAVSSNAANVIFQGIEFVGASSVINQLIKVDNHGYMMVRDSILNAYDPNYRHIYAEKYSFLDLRNLTIKGGAKQFVLLDGSRARVTSPITVQNTPAFTEWMRLSNGSIASIPANSVSGNATGTSIYVEVNSTANVSDYPTGMAAPVYE